MEYLAELASTMQQMRQGTLAIVVDIRNWYIEPDTAKQNTNYSLHLDRRNQIAEVWIISENNQAKHLDVFFNPLNFTPARVTSRQELEQWATDNHIELPEELY